MTLRRFGGLVATLALVQLSLGSAPSVCTWGRTGTAPTSLTHEAMNMGDASARLPAGELPPCNSHGDADCASMPSCAAATAETQALSVSATVPAEDVIVAVGAAHVSTTPSPDTPPPRV